MSGEVLDAFFEIQKDHDDGSQEWELIMALMASAQAIVDALGGVQLAIEGADWTNNLEVLGERFGEWLADQKDRDDPIGDLARDLIADVGIEVLPNMSLAEVGARLRTVGASQDAFDAYIHAFCKYLR